MSTTSSVVFIAERVAYIRFEMRCECIQGLSQLGLIFFFFVGKDQLSREL